MPDAIETKVRDLMTRHAAVLQKKAALSGQLQAKKDELVALVNEIKAAGIDPKNLAEESRKAKAALEAEVATFEAEISKVETALAAFDKK
jgi:uncharacterized protein YoxC